MTWELDQHDSLPYRYALPPRYDATKQYPLVVYLHGSGERGDDTTSHLVNGVDALLGQPFIAVAPQCPRGETFGGSWYGGASATQSKVVRLVRALASRSTVDPQRVSLIGFSMGGIGLWDLLLRYRELFCAGVPIAGDLDLSSVGALAGVPIWAFHGQSDKLVKPAAVREVAKLLGPPFRYTEFPGVGHDSWRGAFSHPDLVPWLLAQRR